MAHKINYKAIKKKLSKFIKTESYNDKNILETINDAVNRTNKIVFKTHLLLRFLHSDKGLFNFYYFLKIINTLPTIRL